MSISEKNLAAKTVISPVEIMQFMTHNSLHLYKRKGSQEPIHRILSCESKERMNPHRKGAVFVSPSKADLAEGKGYVITSYEALRDKYRHLTHWTPNTYRGGTYYDFKKRIIKGHVRENLKQINVIGFDIDTKEVDLYALYLGCEELGLPRPNLLLETPRGFQCFFVLESPFYIHKQKDYKSLRVAERLSDNIRKALLKYVPLDLNCTPFGFYRIPSEDNVLDFYDQPANTVQLISWSKQFEEGEKCSFLQLVPNPNAMEVNYAQTDWYHALISAQDIQQGYHSASRNNAIMTLALANYASGRAFEEAYDELDEFNSRLAHPLSKREFERTMKSAYSGKYKGVKRSYVENLLALWTDGKAKFQGREGWYKFKKDREVRERSHYEEWEEDIMTYIQKHLSPEKPFLEASLAVLAKTFGMAVSSLKEVLKRSKNIVKRTTGRGRGAVTQISSRSMLFRHLLHLRRKQIQHAQLSFAQLLPKPYPFPAGNPLEFPALDTILHVEMDTLFRSGSPPASMSG